jgi:hypothetical protein
VNCSHVLGLIDAGPFADYPRVHREAARQHALRCATCGPALRASEAITARLAAVPQPAPPRDLAADVLARIARLDAAATAAGSAPLDARRASLHPFRAFAVLGAGTAVAIGFLVAGAASIDVQSLGFARTTTGLVVMPATIAGALGLAGGLALYTLGLFMPLASERRHD